MPGDFGSADAALRKDRTPERQLHKEQGFRVLKLARLKRKALADELTRVQTEERDQQREQQLTEARTRVGEIQAEIQNLDEALWQHLGQAEAALGGIMGKIRELKQLNVATARLGQGIDAVQNLRPRERDLADAFRRIQKVYRRVTRPIGTECVMGPQQAAARSSAMGRTGPSYAAQRVGVRVTGKA